MYSLRGKIRNGKSVPILLGLLMPLFSTAQQDSAEAIYENINPKKSVQETATDLGVKFEEGLTWEQVKAKAKKENKYIFVDCYATWCGPCKIMDKDIYPLNTVGDAVNNKFIAVKVQMDSTAKDPDHIKLLYPAARQLEKEYKVIGLPTYLFFSSDGEAVHKDMGQKKAEDFITLLSDATNPDKQLFTLIKTARAGRMNNNLLPGFINRLNEGGDKTIALELARSYMKIYLETLPDQELCSKKNLDFIMKYQSMLTTKDRVYDMCTRNPVLVDSISGTKGISELLSYNILFYDFITPPSEVAKKSNREPNWNAIKKSLRGKASNERTDSLVIDGKMNWYIYKKDWVKYHELYILKTNRDILKQSLSKDNAMWFLNQPAWFLFEFSFNRKHLEQALSWASQAIDFFDSNDSSQVAILDTKANLLYKLGKKEEAIAIQEKAVSLLGKNKWQEIVTNLNKMKKGEPTWEYGVKENMRVK